MSTCATSIAVLDTDYFCLSMVWNLAYETVVLDTVPKTLASKTVPVVVAYKTVLLDKTVAVHGGTAPGRGDRE